MSPTSKRPLSEDLSPQPSEARLARQWSNIAARTPASPPRRARWPLAVAFAAAIVLVALSVRTITREPTTGAHEVVALADGSRVTLAHESRIRLTTVTASRIHLTLEAGDIALEIPDSESRAFEVSAGNQHISAHGGAFDARVEAKPGKDMLHVGVSRGSIQVTRADGSMPRVLHAGEKWSGPIEPAGSADRESEDEVASAKDLLARATEARVSNHLMDAIGALDELRKRYRGDARAGLAAFELGRLRLDEAGDPAGALEALDDAIELAPDAEFREDAEARRVDALDALGDARCAQARASYLERYGGQGQGGIHARSVRLRCGRP